MKSFLTRLGSGILLVAIILVTGAYGSWPLWIAVTLAGFVGLHEFYRAVDIQKNDLLWWIGMIGTGMWAFIEWIVCGGDLAWKENLWMTLVITLMLFLAAYVFSFPKYDTRKITEAYFGILYVPVMLSFIYQTRMLEDGFQLVWLIFLSAWGCDTCAYCTGELIGKHKLAPVLSPKKSIEGAVGGVAGAALIGFLYAWGLQKAGVTAISDDAIWAFPLISGVGAVLSQLGDLAASGIKRDHNIKDYGRLIPGHGGIMDRFDSVIVTAPLIYYLCIILLEL